MFDGICLFLSIFGPPSKLVLTSPIGFLYKNQAGRDDGADSVPNKSGPLSGLVFFFMLSGAVEPVQQDTFRSKKTSRMKKLKNGSVRGQ